MALGSTQSLTDMSTRDISRGGKGGRCVGLTTLPPSRADCLEIWEPQSAGTHKACNGISFPLPFTLGYGAQGWAARNDVRLLVQFLKILRIVLSRFRIVLGLYRSCDVCINLF